MENKNLNKKRILYVLTKTPYPLLDGTRERIFNELKYLSQDFDVDLLIATTEPLTKENQNAIKDVISGQLFFLKLSKISCYTRALFSIFSKNPLQVEYFNSKKVKRWLCFNFANYDVIYLHTIRLGEYAKTIYKSHNTKILMSLNDALSLNYYNAKVKAKGLWKLIYKLESGRVLNYELEMLKICDKVSIVSENDKRFIENNWYKIYPSLPAPKITVIRNGISKDLFKYEYAPENQNLVFLGNLDYPPNIQGLKYFCQTIMPLIVKEVPKIKLLVIGKGGEKLKGKFRNVEFMGFIKNPYEIICKQAVFINPASFGAGVPSKVILAMALGMPIVSTAVNALSIDGIKDKENIYLIKGDEYKSANIILSLLINKEKRVRMGQKAKELALEKYNFLENYLDLKRLIDG